LGISVEKVHNRLKLGIYVNLQPQTWLYTMAHVTRMNTKKLL
jgi:hypothetical protein